MKMAENGVRTILVDANDQVEHTLILNAEDAKRVQTDIVFASMLLRQAQKVRAAQLIDMARNAQAEDSELRTASPILEDRVDVDDGTLIPFSTITEQDLNIDGDQTGALTPIDNQDEGLCNWTAPMCLLLLSSYEQNKVNFTSGKMSQKQAWEIISRAMKSQQYIVSGSKCNSKFTSMKRTYKSIKDHNSKSGNERKTWPYLQQMDEMFGKKPWVKPLATASSATSSQEPATDSEKETDSTAADSNSGKRKNTTADYLLELVAEKKNARRDREQQHEEKMEQVRKMNILLEKVLQQSK